MAYVKGDNRQQIAMFPEIMDDYVAENNPVRVTVLFASLLVASRVSNFTHSDVPVLTPKNSFFGHNVPYKQNFPIPCAAVLKPL